MSFLGVGEVAVELGVSARRVRQMLADGVVVGERVGGVWVVDSAEVGRVARRRRGVGRPWSAVSAWAVLMLADGVDLVLSPVERSRARKRVGEGLGVVVGRLGARAEVREFYGHPGVVDRLGGSAGVVRGGVSAAAEYGVDVVGVGEFEGYVRVSDVGGLVSRFGLDEGSVRSNVLLRVVDDAVWPFSPGQGVAGRAVVGVDLVESDDARVRRAGVDLLAQV